MSSALVVRLTEPAARDPASTGAKAANLATAAVAGFSTVPGFVLTTTGVAAGVADARVVDELRRAHDELCGPSAGPLVVRSSSTIEDAGASSMAGRFTSVLDVVGWDAFVDAVTEVIRSAETVRDSAGQIRPIAVLVQRQLATDLGGVLFGVDPVTGVAGHVVVDVVATRPDVLVGGTAVADHYVLSRRGRVVRATRTGSVPVLGFLLRRDLVRCAVRAEQVFGAPQDIEWCVDAQGRLWLLQTRPVTVVPDGVDTRSIVLGPGPVAETFPMPLRPLEADLWIEPLREGISRALVATGVVGRRTLNRSPVVTTVAGWAAVDLELFGLTDGRTTLRRRFNPAAIARRLATAWRVGRLRVALPALAESIVATVDRDLSDIPRLEELSTEQLLDTLDGARRELATVHAHEVLTGMLLHDERGSGAAALALETLHRSRAAGWSDEEIIARAPAVLALSPPSVVLDARLPDAVSPLGGDTRSLESLGHREALRLRARWLQELSVRLARELARRLVADGLLVDARLVSELRLGELTTMAVGEPPPTDLLRRGDVPPGPPLPAMFRLARSGQVRAISSSPSRRPSRHGDLPAGTAAGGGYATGTVVHDPPHDTPAENTILVTRHLEPQLAAVLGRVVAIVSETGSALSHLAILAREAGLPTVVAVPDALRRFPPGTHLGVDGTTGEIEILDPPASRTHAISQTEVLL